MHAGEATDEPEHDENDQYEAENAAEPGPAILGFRIAKVPICRNQARGNAFFPSRIEPCMDRRIRRARIRQA